MGLDILFLKLIPLYLMLPLGFVAAQVYKVRKEAISRLLIYIIGPVVVFYGTYSVKMQAAYLLLPLLFYLLATFIAITFLYIGAGIWQHSTRKYILACAAGTGNTGYFGLPVVLALFGDQAFGIAVLSSLGFILFEGTTGFFLASRGMYEVRESIRKIATLPTVYAFLLGLLCNYLDIAMSNIVVTAFDNFKSAYTLLGMMMIGMGLAGVRMRHIDKMFIALSFFARFIIWPAVILGIIILDKNIFGIFNQDVYNIFIVIASVPLATHTVMLAIEFKTHPDTAVIAVLSSTLFSLLYIPFMINVFLY